jgi:hypothetical protein
MYKKEDTIFFLIPPFFLNYLYLFIYLFFEKKMLRFNEDVLFLIFEELKNDKKSLYLCLLVNRTWCVTAVQILWRNPWQITLFEKAENALFNVIFSHLSEESRDILKNQGMNNLFTEISYQRPLFNYISFCRNLDLYSLEKVIFSKMIEESNKPIIRNEILKLFINKNTKLIHISITHNFDYQLHLIPGAEYCFSELESLNFDDNISQNILEGLAGICKSIKKIQLYIISDDYTDSCGIFKLIEMQKNLNDFRLFNISNSRNEAFYKSLEESLIKHVKTIQYLRIIWNPTTRFLSHFVNLLSLEIKKLNYMNWNLLNWNDPNYLRNLSLPVLKFLAVYHAPLNVTVNLIKSTTESLSEISIRCDDVKHYDGYEMLIQAIYQNCPNIKYLKLILNGNLLISEFENLLINCQFLNGLIINTHNNQFSWDGLFQVLTKSSPSSLYKFKFFSNTFKLEDIKSFFDNWENRNPILLKINHYGLEPDQQLVSLIEQYKIEGIIKKYSIGVEINAYEDFEWI